MTEHWKDVPGYEDSYQVSDQGEVLSLPRLNSVGRRIRARILKPTVHLQNGKPMAQTVSLLKGGARRTFSPARLVLVTFIGPPPSDRHVAHFIDRNPLNPKLHNLEWSTVGAITTQQHRRKRG